MFINYFGDVMNVAGTLRKAEEFVLNSEVTDDEQGQKEIDGIFAVQLGMIVAKTAHYGASWRKRGLQDALSNLYRKIDRLETIGKKISEKGESYLDSIEGDEALLDTLGDLGNYAFLIMSLIQARYPHQRVRYFQNALKFIQQTAMMQTLDDSETSTIPEEKS